MSNLRGKVALVTGASKGIGAAIARELAVKGAVVAVNYSGSQQAAEKLVSEINQSGGRAIASWTFQMTSDTPAVRLDSIPTSAFTAIIGISSNTSMFCATSRPAD